ncbi:MAG: cell division protein FtsZ [Rhodobacteraceae bacterium]|nr:cell division protein FtsZ [Paracoccaceae bacterium]
MAPKICVFGVGGAGCSAVKTMMSQGLTGVEFVVANTDAQILQELEGATRIQLGLNVTQGLGAGADPKVGKLAAEESADLIREQLEGVHLTFVMAGMGGGTGTGAAPVVAKIACEMEVLTVGVVTKPFGFEGEQRMSVAQSGVQELRNNVHTSVVIPNQNLFQLTNERTPLDDAFGMADDVLIEGVKSITELIMRPGRINLDFADVRTVLMEMGSSMLGTGEGEGEDRAKVAANRAMCNRLLEDTKLEHAKAVLISVTGGADQGLFDLHDASEEVRKNVGPNTQLIVGSTIDPEYQGRIKVSLIASGMGRGAASFDFPVDEAAGSSTWISDHQAEEQPEEEEFPEGDFQPHNAAWPHAEDQPEIAESSTPEVADTEVDVPQDVEEEAGAKSNGRWSRAFVAPKLSPNEASGESSAPSPAAPRSGNPLVSAIRRMTFGSDSRESNLTDKTRDPALQSRVEAPEDHPDSEEERRIPAFMRRQAN